MEEAKKVYNINVQDIIPNRFQPRLTFNEEELQDLASSIKEHGIIEPLIVRQLGEKYEIIAGERRYKAACTIGLSTVPAIVVVADDKKSAEMAVVENIQRKNLTSIEEAQSYKKLVEKGYTQDEIARKIGVTQATIANKIRLLNLSEEVRNALLSNRISERHARSILALTSQEDQKTMLNKIIKDRLTVKQTDDEINKMLGNVISPIKKEEIAKKSFDIINEYKAPNINDLLKPQEEIIDITKPEHDIPNTLNPFQEQEKEEEKFETLDFNIFDEKEEENPILKEFEKTKPIQTEIVNNKSKLTEAIDKTRNVVSSLKSEGVEVNTEEFDFENMYQIVIKIQKD
ncbi:MAG: ParB/RepB/Spo0J family partition protein [Bacilli bacterium]